MTPEQYKDLYDALTKGDLNDCKEAFIVIQSEIAAAAEADDFNRDQCFELLADIGLLLDAYVSEQLG